MTKLDYVLSGKGNKQQRCLYAAFCVGYGAENGWSEEMAKYYKRCYDEEEIWEEVNQFMNS